MIQLQRQCQGPGGPERLRGSNGRRSAEDHLSGPSVLHGICTHTPFAGLCLKGRGGIGAVPERLQSGHRGCESGWGGGWFLAVGDAVGAGIGVWECLSGIESGQWRGGSPPPPPQAIPCPFDCGQSTVHRLCRCCSRTPTGQYVCLLEKTSRPSRMCCAEALRCCFGSTFFDRMAVPEPCDCMSHGAPSYLWQSEEGTNATPPGTPCR